jgi:hypothetical protein
MYIKCTIYVVGNCHIENGFKYFEIQPGTFSQLLYTKYNIISETLTGYRRIVPQHLQIFNIINNDTKK